MKVRTICVAVVVIAAIAAISPANGQQIGFSVAIAPASSPVQPFSSSPVGSFGVSPIFTPPVISTFVAPSHFQTGYLAPQPRPLVRPPVSAFPHRGVVVVAPGSTIYAPGATVVTGGNNVFVTNTPGRVNHNPQGMHGSHGSHGRHASHGRLPAAGTPRSQVILQFGSPLVSVLTMNGETMHFSGGTTISLQNGLVVRP